MPPAKRPSTAKKTGVSQAKARAAEAEKKSRKRQKLEQEAKKSHHDHSDTDGTETEEEVDVRARKKATKGIPDHSLKMQELSMKLANLEKENQELKARKKRGSPKNSEDEESDFSDDDQKPDDLDEEQQWSNRKIKKYVREYGEVPLKTDMVVEIAKSADKILFRFIKFIPKESHIKPACEKLLEKDPKLKQYYKVKSLCPKAYKKLVKKFVADYGDTICRAINRARTTAQSEMKKAYLKGLKLFGGKENMPTPKELQQVVLRKGLLPPGEGTFDNLDPGFQPYVMADNIRKELDHARDTIAELGDDEDVDDDETVANDQESTTKRRKKSSRKAKESAKKAKELDEEEQNHLRLARDMLVKYTEANVKARDAHEVVRMEAWKQHCLDKYERNMKIFMWYWMSLLPCICRNHQWGQSKRLYGHISTHAPLDDRKDKYVTATDESFVAIVYENCGQRFPFLAKLLEEDVKFNEATHGKDPQYQAKWSSSTKGQSKFGGWDDAAILRFDQIATLVSLARKREAAHLNAVETAALNQIQGKKRIEDGSLDAGGDDSDEEEEEKVELPESFATLAYDSDVDDQMEAFELEDPTEVYKPVPETKAEKKKKAKASRSG